MADTPRYRFGPLERRGLLMGLRAAQVAVVGAALLCCVLTLTASPSLGGLASESIAAFRGIADPS
ncbi:MAG: hypothetical protein ACRDG7_03425 [Candidatus Limnocylindria bacterium]